LHAAANAITALSQQHLVLLMNVKLKLHISSYLQPVIPSLRSCLPVQM
jgi:hypothetical protein